MPTFTNESPAAAQQLDAIFAQTRRAALKQGRPWSAESSQDIATGELRLTVVVGPQPPVVEAAADEPEKTVKPRKAKQPKLEAEAPPPVAEAATDVKAA